MQPEVIHLPFDIPGVGKRGDCIVSDPVHPDPRFRLSRVEPLDEALLLVIKAHITRSRPLRNHRWGQSTSLRATLKLL